MGLLRNWLLGRVVASALTLEAESLQIYRRLRERVGPQLDDPLAHLLEEDERHWQILEAAAAGKLDLAELDRLVREHLYGGMERIEPLDPAARARWGAELEAALAQEERTLVFYGNLQRISKIPSVRHAFKVIAGMEREHVEILRRLLGRHGQPQQGSSLTRWWRRRSPPASTG